MSKELLIPEVIIDKDEWYQALIDDCKSIITEAIFTSRWSLVEGYWNLGKRINEENNNFERANIYGKKIVQRVGKSLDISKSTLYYALKFYDKYPDLSKVPEGKNITWKKIITKYLPEYKEKENILAPIEGTYEVIVIDPPWPYGTEYNQESRRVASPYKELSLEQLEQFKLPTADSCVLWLWTTHKFLHPAFHLLDAWEFDYKLTFVWDKVKMGMGVWLRCQVEFCLLATKGKPRWNLINERDLLSIARGKHSVKPDKFYNMVEKLCPTKGKYADIFSRKERPGWKSYGNEVK